tara:strand:+ start:24 stop:938 length:915 start_codon:yes stop_codon:yes gene_type:complete
MTVQELGQRLARYTTKGTLSNLATDDRLMLLDCINSAVFNWFIAAPENLRQTTVSHFVRAPETISATATFGSNLLTGVTLQDFHLGASIMLDGDTIMNEIVNTAVPQVLNQFRGTTGAVNGRISHDTIMLTDHHVSRIVSNPRVLDSGQELVRDDEGMMFMGAERKGRERRGVLGASVTRDVGEPTRYCIDNTGVSLKGEARIMMRLDPVPDKDLTITFDAVIDPPSHDLSDFNGATALAVPDQYILPHVLPLALGDLAMSPIWANADASAAMSKSNRVIAAIQTALQPNRGAPRNRVRTRPGY